MTVTRKLVQGLAWVALLLFTGSCNAGTQLMKEGHYLGDIEVKSATIKGDQITFKLMHEDRSGVRLVERTYRYSHAKDGRINLVASSNDPVFVFSLMKYHWYWNGETIVRKGPEKGIEVVFTPDERGPDEDQSPKAE